MITIQNEFKNLLLKNYKQIIKIEFPHNNVTIRMTERDLVEGSFVWDRYCATGNMLELGSAIASEIQFSVRNNGYFYDTSGNKIPTSNIRFEGKELTVSIGISKWNARRWENAQVYWVQIGKFIITTMPHKFSTMFISALDRMTLFDVNAQRATFQTQETLHSLVQKICTALSISYTMSSSLPNYNLSVNMDTLFEEEVTYREIIHWVAELTGTCAYFNNQGNLVFRWFENSGETIDKTMRYSSTMYEPVSFTGIVVEKENETFSLGSEGGSYRYGIQNNSLIQGEDWTVKYNKPINYLWQRLLSFTSNYVPFESETFPLLYLEPLDRITYVDNNGTSYNTLITHITYTVNGSTGIKAIGQSETEAKHAAPSSTSKQTADVQALKKEILDLRNATTVARESLSSLMRQALGLHVITVTDSFGGVTYYYTTANVSNNPTLSEMDSVLISTDVIYTFNANGLAWCSGQDWIDSNGYPTWKYGITRDGTAVLGQVNAEGINVSNAGTTYKTTITPDMFAVYLYDTLVFALNGQSESQINRLVVKSNIDDPTEDNDAYIRIGNIMIVPAQDGADFVYCEDV